MKGQEIVDAVIEASNMAIVVELKNGKKLTTKDYYFDTNARGDDILVVCSDRELKK